MGCACMLPLEVGRGVEVVYEESRVMLSKRPQTYSELLSVIFRLVPEASKPSDVVIEYCSSDCIRTVACDLTLHEAYASATGPKVIIGVRLSKNYVPFELLKRGNNRRYWIQGLRP